MSNTNNGGPAFPVPGMAERWNDCKGMTLRDYFAAKAIVAVNENFAPVAGEDVIDWADFIARNAYRVADAMLKARAKAEGAAA